MIDVCLVMPVYSVPTLANSTIQSVMDEGHIRGVNQGGQWSRTVNEAGQSLKPVSEKLLLLGSIGRSSSLTD